MRCMVRFYVCTEHFYAMKNKNWLGTFYTPCCTEPIQNTLCISCYLVADQNGWMKELYVQTFYIFFV